MADKPPPPPTKPKPKPATAAQPAPAPATARTTPPLKKPPPLAPPTQARPLKPPPAHQYRQQQQQQPANRKRQYGRHPRRRRRVLGAAGVLPRHGVRPPRALPRARRRVPGLPLLPPAPAVVPPSAARRHAVPRRELLGGVRHGRHRRRQGGVVGTPTTGCRSSTADGEGRVALADADGDVALGWAPVAGFRHAPRSVATVAFVAAAKGVVVDEAVAARVRDRYRRRQLAFKVVVDTHVGARAGAVRTGMVPVRLLCDGGAMAPRGGVSGSVVGPMSKCQVYLFRVRWFSLN
ncbi:hypothetical protein OsJ_06151 [Oryza sativa Japonica Group]|uniref:Uncharacterized protein n=1 Tax=Oryza sativa subsp. japonica TaxID=39947 RepID=B9F4W1_ORYSJ|nr:hypothetical protein OsJ_06151 [Oryza sativa Japonica Group]